MSPAQIHILLNHYAMAEKTYEACSSGMSEQFYSKCVAEMKECGLIEENGETTKMGDAYVDMLCATPFPVQKFVDPRLNP